MQRRSWKAFLLASTLVACGGKSERPSEGEAEKDGGIAAVGDVCVAPEENDSDFAGFGIMETSIDTNAPACGSGICVVHGFQGRVSCPYGQKSSEGECRTSVTGEPVTVTVAPQLVARPPSIASLCSCACRGQGPGPFCSCPSGMECADVLGETALGPVGDWFCVTKQTVQRSLSSDEVCDRSRSNCENLNPAE
jgi:hypothetical protein